MCVSHLHVSGSVRVNLINYECHLSIQAAEQESFSWISGNLTDLNNDYLAVLLSDAVKFLNYSLFILKSP